VERILANVDADEADRILERFCHGVLLVFGAPRKHHLLVGREHGRTSAARLAAIPAGESPANRGVQTLL